MPMTFALCGNLARDPELSTYGPDNQARARLSVASNPLRGRDVADFFDVTVFGDASPAGEWAATP
jgi:single-stranded DNA-binding protein